MNNKARIENIRYKYYTSEDHETLRGHTVQLDIYYEDNFEVKKRHIVLTQKDLIIAALKKHQWITDNQE